MAEDCERTLLRRELIRELFEEDRSISELSKLYGLSRSGVNSWSVGSNQRLRTLFALPAERESLLADTTSCDRQPRAEKKDTLGLR
jgi:hypothetical protein